MLGRTTQMAIDHQTLFKPLTKKTLRLQVDHVDAVLADMFETALAEVPGPVHIGLPEGFGDLRISCALPKVSAPQMPADPCESVLLEMEKMIRNAHKPLLAVGLTAVRLGLGEIIVQIAEKHQLPVVLTPMAKGLIDEDHRCYAGVLFHALSDVVAQTNRQADLVVAVGYDPVEFNFESWMPEVPLVHIDTVACDIDREVYRTVCDVVGNPESALNRLLALDSVDSVWDMDALRERREAMFARFEPKEGVFGPLSVLKILREVLPDEGIMTCDVGAHTHLIGQAWRTRHPYGQLMTNGWSSMGFGIPAALGAKLACPDVPVVCITGDGGYMMMAGELATARRIGKNVVIIVLSDTKLELIRLKQKKRGKVTEGTTLSDAQPPLTEYMFGVPVLPADSSDSFRAALVEAFSAEGPVVVHAIVDQSEYEPLILRKHT